MRSLTSMIIAGVSVLGFAASANAALISGLTGGSPDVTSQAMEVTYTNLTSSTGTFTALGTADTLNPGNVTITSGSFSLTLNITHDAAGDVTGVTSGALTVSGNAGSGVVTLFNYSAATAPQFGYSTSSNTPDFDVLFPSGGTGTQDPGSGPIGLILHAGTSITNYTTNLFSQSFTTEFAQTTFGPGSVDTFADTVPEPASLAFAAFGIGACLLRRRRKLA